MSMLDEFRQELGSRLIGKTITKPSRWAEKRRVMGNPFPGPYSFLHHPWCRELHDSQATWNVSMKSAQAGFTEVGINLALFYVDVMKRNVLYVLPTLTDASDFSKSRFNPALKMSPYLKSVFTDTNNVGLKMAGSISLYIRGSRGDSNLKSIPVSILILDELDEMDQSQIELAMQRLRGQPEKKVWYISTPTSPNHGVSLEYAKSTQEHFFFKCPSCNRQDEFRFPDSIKICGESMNDPECYRSYFQCTLCGYEFKNEKVNNVILQYDKMQTLYNTGFWKPTVTGVDDDRRGFKINQLYSATVTAGEIVIDYHKAQINPYAAQEFHKSVLGEAYIGEKSSVTAEMIAACTKPYRCKQFAVVPNGKKRMITMGIDQGKWCFYTICEWFYPELTLDLNAHAQCRVLDIGRFFEDEWEVVPDRLMHEWQVRACMVDADPNIQEARRFARRFPRFVWLNRYRTGRAGKEFSIDDDGSYAPVVVCDRTNWLDVALGRFFSGTIEIPCDPPIAFSEHLRNLVRLYEEDQNGNPIAVYRNFGPDHYAHSLNYAEMALPCAVSVATNKNIGKFL